jgi:hypothetical protein
VYGFNYTLSLASLLLLKLAMSERAHLLFNVLKLFSLQTSKSRRVQSWSFSQRSSCALCVLCACSLTYNIHATEYLCSQRYLCALFAITAHAHIVQSIAQRAEAVEI